MVQGIFFKSFKSKFLEDFIDDVANTSTSYFVTFGKYDEWPVTYNDAGALISDDTLPPATNNSIKTSFHEVHRNLLYGKQITESNLSYVIKKRTWVSGTVYDYYDDSVSNLYDRNFYVINTDNRVYKCLFNNYGAPSTIEPNDYNPNGDFVTLPDGYKWKYMYRINAAENIKFASSTYVPVITDSSVQSYASNGAIHVIVVDNGGVGYPNANGTVIEAVNGNTFKVSPVGIENINGIYIDSSLYVYSGTGNNFISTVADYTVNSTGNFITTADLLPSLDSTSRYKIGPTVRVDGDGTNVKAFAYVDIYSSNSVNRIDVINQGSEYTRANVTLVANSIAIGSAGGAVAHAIVSPPGGHGSNAIDELGCDTLAISVDVTDPLDSLPNWATYRQIALLNNPSSPDNNGIYNSTYFKQYTTLTLQIADIPFNKDAIIEGLQSGATGKVIHSDAGNTYLIDVVGQFQTYENVQEPSSLVTNIISEINTKDLLPYSGKILYYKNIEPVVRYNGSREQVKIYFKI